MSPRKYYLLSDDNYRSQRFIVNNSENCQLLRETDFSVIANKQDKISLRLFDKKEEIIAFDYLCCPSNEEQTFNNDKVQLKITFNYKFTGHSTYYMLFCPSFNIMKHPSNWSKYTHYGQCGQPCPCCRSGVGDTLGACPICRIVIQF